MCRIVTQEEFLVSTSDFNGEAEAKLIALACTKPPQGYAHWTLRLLEQRVVELGIVEAASYTTIYRVLKENELKPYKNKGLYTSFRTYQHIVGHRLGFHDQTEQ